MMDADYFRSENIKPLKPVEPIMTDRDRIAESEYEQWEYFRRGSNGDGWENEGVGIKDIYYGRADQILSCLKKFGYTRQPSQDKVEAVAQRIGELYCGKFKWEHLDDFTDGSYWHELVHGAAREILRLFLEYVPVKLETLGDEERLKLARKVFGSRDGVRPVMPTRGDLIAIYSEEVSQDTIKKNQKGQLYRLKEE